MKPPVAPSRPHTTTHHGIETVDDFQWLRDPQDPAVIEHLNAENAYTEAVTADQQSLRDTIYQEIKSRTIETDMFVPSRYGDWWYFSRTEEGAQYPIFCRVPATNSDDQVADWTPPKINRDETLPGEQVILDGNVESADTAFFAVGDQAISPDGNLLAYLVDETGDEYFTLRIRDLTTGENLADEVTGLSYGLAFDPTGTRVFYVVPDATWRPYQVKVHTVGTEATSDQLLFEEPDPTLWTGIELSSDQQELLINIGNAELSETRSVMLVASTSSDHNDGETYSSTSAVAAGTSATAEFEVKTLISRDRGMLHDVTPAVVEGQRVYFILHNIDPNNTDPAGSLASDDDVAGARVPNNMLSKAPADQITELEAWETVIEHRQDTKLDLVGVTQTHLVIQLRAETTPKVVVSPLDRFEPRALTAQEELYSAEVMVAPYRSPFIRISYTSWVTPPQVWDFHAETGEVHIRRAHEVPNYEPGEYLVERWWAPAESTNRRVAIPLTVIRHKNVEWDGNNPAVIYGYGSYEISMDPAFSVARLSLLDRNVVYVVAHVRGGGELGRNWYEDGKKFHKKNSFTDFVDATRFVAASGWVHPDKIAAMGGSAGGLLMGGVLNTAPELYRACLAVVPFVDALTSILDPDLPLSALEWEEWGNPIENKEVYEYMDSYTPYSNVQATDYPAIAAVTSLHDTRVSYGEPAKWVQQLRRTVTSDQDTPLAEGGAPILLRTEMDGGHGGASGRYRAWEDTAWEYAFLLTALSASIR